MSLFLNRADFEHAAGKAGITDLATDGEAYVNAGTQSAYLVWLSVALPAGATPVPDGWISRRNGRRAALLPHRPPGPGSSSWELSKKRGWDAPLPVFANAPGASPATIDVVLERQRQQLEEGYDAAHDGQYTGSQLARAAACYALKSAGLAIMYWPWPNAPIKDCGRRESLIKAGALILAQLDTLDAAEQAEGAQ